jgi:uncharacterized membrane protein YeaQ/YmgE (transglycosylase-associated protein family)
VAHVLSTGNPRLSDAPGLKSIISCMGERPGAIHLPSRRFIMSMFAQIYLEPGGIIAWLIVGLVAGFLAGKVMRGIGYGLVGDIIVGVVGAFIGGFVFGLAVNGDYGLLGSIVVAFLGACLLIWVVRRLAPGPAYV